MGNGILFAPARNQGWFFGQESPGQRGGQEQGETPTQGIFQAKQDRPALRVVSVRSKGRGRRGGFLRHVPRVVGRAVSALLIFLIKLYKHGVSPMFPSSCRFQPSCSEYAVSAINKHGPIRGLGLSAWRLLRCGPWSEGGYDPVPESGGGPGNPPNHGFNQEKVTRNEETA